MHREEMKKLGGSWQVKRISDIGRPWKIQEKYTLLENCRKCCRALEKAKERCDSDRGHWRILRNAGECWGDARNYRRMPRMRKAVNLVAHEICIKWNLLIKLISNCQLEKRFIYI